MTLETHNLTACLCYALNYKTIELQKMSKKPNATHSVTFCHIVKVKPNCSKFTNFMILVGNESSPFFITILVFPLVLK